MPVSYKAVKGVPLLINSTLERKHLLIHLNDSHYTIEFYLMYLIQKLFKLYQLYKFLKKILSYKCNKNIYLKNVIIAKYL